MDFVTLANSAHETTRILVRLLTEDTNAAAGDDDFAHLENIGGRSSHPDNGYSDGATSETATSIENRPLLSPTAEAALLELSTNFLLCELFLCVECIVCFIICDFIIMISFELFWIS